MRSTGLEPSAGEVATVYAVMITGLVSVLGLLAVLMWRRRRLGLLPADGRPYGGLVLLVPIASLIMYLTVRELEFVRVHRGDDLSLFALHGTAEPVHWVAQTVGGALLVILAGLAARFRDRVGWAVAVPALLLTGLLVADLLAIAVKARRLGDRLLAEQLPALTPEQLKSASVQVGALESNGLVLWGMAVLILAFVALSSVLRRHEVYVVAGLAAVCALAVPVLPLTARWALRGDGVVRVEVSVLDVLPIGLAPIALALVTAALLPALPVLGKWWRGAVALVLVAFPVALLFVMLQAADAADRELPRLLAEAGVRNAVRAEEGGAFTLLSTGALVLVPIAGIRGWLAARRRSAGAPPLPVQRVAPGAVSHFTSQT